MERYPVDIGVEYQAGCYKERAEFLGINALGAVLFKVCARFLEHLDGLLIVHVVFERELEVEGPGAWANDNVVRIALQ